MKVGISQLNTGRQEASPANLRLSQPISPTFRVDVIVTYGSAPTRAAQQATTTTPIVMIAVGDPIKAGFAQNLARPGGNITGNSVLGTEMAAKRVELLKQLIPGVSRVAFLWNPNNASHLAYLEEWRAAGPILGVEPIFVEVGHPGQLEPAFVTMIQKRPDALSITADPFHMAQVGWIIDFVAKNRLPSLYVAKENVVAGGLVSYGPSIADLFRRALGTSTKFCKAANPQTCRWSSRPNLSWSSISRPPMRSVSPYLHRF